MPRRSEDFVAGELAVHTPHNFETLPKIQGEGGLVAAQYLGENAPAACGDGVSEQLPTNALLIPPRVDIEPRELALEISNKSADLALGLGDKDFAIEQALTVSSLFETQESIGQPAGAQFIEPRRIVDDAELRPVVG